MADSFLLGPLGLEHTVLTTGEPLPPDLPRAHRWADMDGDGVLEDLTSLPITASATLTHPLVFTTAVDLVRWTHALLHEAAVVDRENVVLMTTPPDVDSPDPEGVRFGMGIADYSGQLGVRAIGHAGSAVGYSAAALFLPDLDTSVVWLVNTGESPADLAGDLMGRIWDALYGVLRQHPPG
jgi:CubicO group peptidase (beta-lactamase class C family)